MVAENGLNGYGKRIPAQTMKPNPQLVQLGAPAVQPLWRMEFLIDKFFVVGAVSSLIGGAVLGAHLWMMLNGRMPMASDFVWLRHLHALVQTYLFFGLFILGFLLQTAPKILKVKLRIIPLFLAAVPLLFGGVTLELQSPGGLGRWVLAFPFAATALLVGYLASRGHEAFRESYAWWVILSLCGLAVSPFFPVDRADNAQLFIWGGVVPVTFATGQQFIFAFLGGARLAKGINRILFALYSAALVALFAARVCEIASLWRVGGGLAAASLAVYIVATSATRAASSAHRDPLSFAFVTGYGWGIVGSLMLAFAGPDLLDSAFHILVLGWFTPLIIAVSSQVLGAISGKFLLPKWFVHGMLLVWQVVPVGRGLRSVIDLSPGLSLVVATVTSIVFLLWMIGVANSAVRIARKKSPMAVLG